MTLPFQIQFAGPTHAWVMVVDGKCQVVINTYSHAEEVAS